MTPGILSAGIDNTHTLRYWEPEDPDVVSTFIFVDIGPRTRGKGARDQVKKSDTFTLQVVTPAGLGALMETQDSIHLFSRKLLVMRRYDSDELWQWLERTVASCEAPTWQECVDKLRTHFHWEFEGMTR